MSGVDLRDLLESSSREAEAATGAGVSGIQSVAQAMVEGMVLVSKDAVMVEYGVSVLW